MIGNEDKNLYPAGSTLFPSGGKTVDISETFENEIKRRSEENPQKSVREIRQELTEEIAGMTPDEQLEYFRTNNQGYKEEREERFGPEGSMNSEGFEILNPDVDTMQESFNKISENNSGDSDDDTDIIWFSGNRQEGVPSQIGLSYQSERQVFDANDPDGKSLALRKFFDDEENRADFAEDLYMVGSISNDYSLNYSSAMYQGATEALEQYKASPMYLNDSGSFKDWVESSANSARASGKELPDGWGESGGGSGRYTGPVTTRSLSNVSSEDLRTSLNSFATDMLGRNLTEKELKKYAKQYKSVEKTNFTETTRTPRGDSLVESVTKSPIDTGIIIRDTLRDSPSFTENVMRTDVLDMFANRLGGLKRG